MTLEQTAVVTDSTSDIPYSLADELGIHIVANHLNIGGETHLDDRNFSRPDFYQRLPTLLGQMSTAAIGPGVYHQLYEKLAAAGVQRILSFHPSSLLSGVYNVASTAARAFDDLVQVVDSRSISLGLGFQAVAAAEALRAGALVQQALQAAERARQHVTVIALLDTLEFVRRSGRVSWAKARLGDLLKIKPFIDVREGKVLSIGEARTRRKGLERLRELLAQRGRLERLAVMHANAESDALELAAEFTAVSQRPPLVVSLTPVIGVHTGPQALGFAAVAAG